MSDKAPAGAAWNEHGPWSRDEAAASGVGRPDMIGRIAAHGRRMLGRSGGPRQRHRRGNAWVWGLLALAALWIAATSVHMIGGAERGLVIRLGRFAGELEPGLHVTLPTPIDRVRTVDVDRIHETAIDGGDRKHASANLMLTGDGGLIDLAYTVRWSVADPELYLFELSDPGGTIRAVAESAMREAIAGVGLGDAMGRQRGPIAARVAVRMQAILDGYRAGIAVRGIVIRRAEPPAELLDAVKDVAAARQQTQALLARARSYATQVKARAAGDASAFDQVYAQYRLAPEVTRKRMYYETMERVLAKTDKVIVETPGVTPYLPIQPKPPK